MSSSRTDQTALMVLARTPGLRPRQVLAGLSLAGSPTALLGAPRALWMRAGFASATCQYLTSELAVVQAAEQRWLDADGHRVIACTDLNFPPMLRAGSDCPAILFVAGDVSLLSDAQLAVVGSRSPTRGGLETAYDFAHTLAARGLIITSGLADGIDTAAHQGALRAGGATIAVLGQGIDRVYPARNLGLSEQIARHGALVSEFAPGTPPRASHFPRRNRLIAGLSLGTLVVEATPRSGSLITARIATDEGREVFAVPGSIHNPLARGCHELIRAGAHLTETADDILRQLNFSALRINDLAMHPRSGENAAGGGGLDKDQKILLDALGFDTADLDVLVVRTGFKPEAVSSMMLILELEGHVRAAPGGRYSRANRRAGVER